MANHCQTARRGRDERQNIGVVNSFRLKAKKGTFNFYRDFDFRGLLSVTPKIGGGRRLRGGQP